MARTLVALEVLVLTFGFAWLAFVGPLAWMMRDGLGPRAMTSHGTRALLRFGHTYHYATVAIALVVAAVLLDRSRRIAEQNHGAYA